MEDEWSSNAKDYIRLWRTVIVDFLGHSDTELNEMIDYWRDGLLDKNLVFYHESPEYYIAHWLIPGHLERTLNNDQRMRLGWVLYPVIGRYDRECNLAKECFDMMRADIDCTIANFLSTIKID